MTEQNVPTRRSAGRPGRKFSPVRADTEEYKALALFLRKRMEAAEMTVQKLVDTGATRLSKSAISERLAGAKLEEKFITAVIEACTEATRLRPSRHRLLAEGLSLLGRAEKRRTPVLDVTREKDPALRNIAVASQQRLLELHEELLVKYGQLEALDRVRHQSELALRDATSLASVLSVWVVVLADEVEHLTRDREETMSAVPPDLVRLRSVDVELHSTVRRHERTREGLAHTERDRQLAAALLAEAMTRTREIRRELLRMPTARQLPGSQGMAEASMVRADLAAQHVYGDDVDAALDRAETVSRTIADRLRSAVTDLDDGAETLPLSAVDNADNASASADDKDNALWWDTVGQVPTESFTWAEETAASLLAARNPQDPSFHALVRDCGPRMVMLVADRLLAHQWVEGSVRLRVALAVSLPPKQLAPLLIALATGAMQRSEHGAQMLLAAVLLRSPSDVLSLTSLIDDGGNDLPQTLQRGLAAFARRPRADVSRYLREQLVDRPRMASHSVVDALVREWPAEDVLALTDELMVIEDGVFGWTLLGALPQPPIVQTELLLGLWSKLPRVYFAEALPSLYQGTWQELASVIANLHRDWPPPLDRAARELAADVMPLILRRESLDGIDAIARALAMYKLSPERIFEPYKEMLTPGFTTWDDDD